jgi:hypothetical protein
VNTLQEGQGFDEGPDYNIENYKNMADKFEKEWKDKYYAETPASLEVHVYVYVYMCVCMYLDIYIFIIYIRICMCIYIHIYAYVYKNGKINTMLRLLLHWRYIHMCMYVCMYVWI